MNICKFDSIQDELIQIFRQKSLIPIVGSGVSVGCQTAHGEVPSGTKMKSDLIEMLNNKQNFTEEEKSDFSKSKLPELCSLFEDEEIFSHEERRAYYTRSFHLVELDDTRKKFFEINWPYVYSLNVDDAIERNTQYKEVLVPNRKVNAEIFSNSRCLIKLHGDISDILKYSDSKKIFSTKEYAISRYTNEHLWAKLCNDFACNNIIFCGCSLDSEIDLLALDYFSKNNLKKNTVSRIFYATTSTPNTTIKSALRSYGITDVILFENYNDIYSLIHSTWEEAEKIPTNDLNCYSDITVKKLDPNFDNDKQYLIFGKRLLKPSELTLPSFFIDREISEDTAKFLSSGLNIFLGGRFHGKSYLLAGLYRMFSSRTRFLFDGNSKLNFQAINHLLSLKKTIFFFDVGSLTPEQFSMILNSKNKEENIFFIALNKSDSESIWKIKNCTNKSVLGSNPAIHELENKFKRKELQSINKKLPIAHIPVFKSCSILDNIIEIEESLSLKGMFSKVKLSVRTHKDLAYLIIMATKNTISTLNLFEFDIMDEYMQSANRYAPFIEMQDVCIFEKDATDASNKKVIVNAPLWLYKALGTYAENKSNHAMIASSYVYIISMILELTKRRNKGIARKTFKEFILFDTINLIFAKSGTGQMSLISSIYAVLRPLLGTDFNFLHQSAKCDLWNNNTNSEERVRTLESACNKIVIAISIINNELENNDNRNLNISLAHIQFTHATILSALFSINEHKELQQAYKALDATELAFLSPYNNEYLKKELNNREPTRISTMLNEIASNQELKTAMNSEYREKLSKLLKQLIEF